MEYILSEKKYFSSYIEGGANSMEDYCREKTADGVWGDDLELQAMREIYNIPIEIYAYSN
jgi:OTU domain-containing protein 5